MKSGWRRERRRLWQECARLVAELEIDLPFDSAEFVDRLARRRGRRIELVPIHARSATPCGILLSTDQADYLCYAVNTSPLHREHILLHEAGHLVCGHTGQSTMDAVPTALLPHLSAELVRRVLCRSSFDDAQERQAELFASLILHRAARWRPPPTTPTAANAGSVTRLVSLLRGNPPPRA
jgi:hypothetical protein